MWTRGSALPPAEERTQPPYRPKERQGRGLRNRGEVESHTERIDAVSKKLPAVMHSADALHLHRFPRKTERPCHGERALTLG